MTQSDFSGGNLLLRAVTLRAVVIGFALGIFIAGATYYNDFIIGQSLLIYNLLAVSTLGFALVLMLAINPLLGKINRSWVLRGPEIAVIIALGLCASNFPDAAFFRGATTTQVMPWYWDRTQTSWQAAGVMSYVPGGRATIAPGQVRNWRGFVADLVAQSNDPPNQFVRELWEGLTPAARGLMREVAGDPAVQVETLRFTSAINRLLEELPPVPGTDESMDDWPAHVRLLVQEGAPQSLSPHERILVNRWRLIGAFPQWVIPPPAGDGVIFAGGVLAPESVDEVIMGARPDAPVSLWNIPWSLWWPTIRLWWLTAIVIGLACLCIAVIVHPQWSRRELLPYPIARFVTEMIQQDASGWPKVALQRIFWVGFLAVVGFHLYNGLALWTTGLSPIPMRLGFTPLRELFPNASRVPGSWSYFHPTIFLAVVAFAFFLNRAVSFSLGIAPLVFMAFGAMLLSYGVSVDADYLVGRKFNMLRFGGYIGMVLVIFYSGRHYYWQLSRGTVGLSASAGSGVAVANIWAARFLIITALLAIALLTTGGVGWVLATALVGLMLMTYLVLARIVAETGLFFAQAWWLPVGVLTALLGFEVMGPTGFIVAALASIMLIGDTRNILLANLVNGLKIFENSFSSGEERKEAPQTGRMVFWLAIMVVVSFVVAGGATMYLQYNHGLLNVSAWERQAMPMMPFDGLTLLASEAEATGTLSESVFASGWQRLEMFKPIDNAWMWTGIGLALVLGAGLARLRFVWWPIHPVIFLVWGTYPIDRFAFSFLLGWMLKSAVVGCGGAKAYQQMVPLMIGIIAGELLVTGFWMLVGAIYYFNTGLSPIRYIIL